MTDTNKISKETFNKILDYLKTHNTVTATEIRDKLHVDFNSAKRVLTVLVNENKLTYETSHNVITKYKLVK